MKKAREAAMAQIIELLSMFDGKNASVTEVESMLNDLSDAEFDVYMQKLQSGDEILPYYLPNLGKIRITAEKNLKIAKKLGHDFFQRLWLTDPATGQTYLTPKKYLVIDLPLKRLQQHLLDKIKIPASNKHIDELTGQPSGASKGSTVSFPELQILYSTGLERTLTELIKFRGGDEEAYRELSKDAMNNGIPSMAAAYDPSTRVKSTVTVSTLLRAAHLDNNL